MSPRSPKSAPATPALTAFLRGVERRGAVFAELLTGSPEVGDAALEAAMRGFREVAAGSAFGDWPRRFWSLLLASPGLRDRPVQARWPDSLGQLSALGIGPRAALLLRLVAGLAEVDAAAVLGVSRPSYRLALQRALPHGADGTPDTAAWQALGEAAHAQVRSLPPERLAHLARGREAALQQGRRAVAPGTAADVARPGWLRPALATVAVVTALAFAATFLDRGVQGAPSTATTSEPLPAAESPASGFAADAALASHPDLDLLLDDAGEPAAAEPDFYSWYAAQGRATPPDVLNAGTAQALPAIVDPAQRPPDAPVPETIDAPR